ncbi:hypothetical protein [Salinispira pacifica]|uniref:Polysaccharide chain length determinant N-terminal domain-containing protein n=1 Tax=Salinispira pacifica TaxID=1307761 RepID=V5WMR1_9SPIO|nr:hypothetical protein [Salinispira pacifica]AHC16476.1 hypothetical protein L21SP2_3134 [Salinispira pacifica]
MDTQPVNNPQPDEISLVDIIVVFIKRRRLLVASASLAIFLSILVLYIFPLFNVYLYDPGTRYTAERIIQLPVVSEDLKNYIPLVPEQRVSVMFADPAFIASEYEDVMEDKNGMSATAYASFLRENVLGKQLVYNFDAKQGTATLRFTHQNKDDAERFLNDVATKARARLLNEYTRGHSDAQTAVSLASESTLQQLSALDNVRQSDITPLAELQNDLARMRVLMNRNDFPWSMDDPVIYEDSEGTSRSVLLVVIVMAVVFLAVFIAFILEYADKVKSDPEEMEKIRRAWNWKRK